MPPYRHRTWRDIQAPRAVSAPNNMMSCCIGLLPASGKGILSYIRLLVEPIHDEIRKEVTIQMKAYKKEKAEYDAMEAGVMVFAAI